MAPLIWRYEIPAGTLQKKLSVKKFFSIPYKSDILHMIWPSGPSDIEQLAFEYLLLGVIMIEKLK